MTNHACPRCGLENRCSHGSWADRHPAAAVTAGLFTLAWMSMMLSVYPGAALAIIAIAAATWGVRATGRERRRREALAARADWEHRQVMAAALKWPAQLPPAPPKPPAPARRRGADHTSPTVPLRTGEGSFAP